MVATLSGLGFCLLGCGAGVIVAQGQSTWVPRVAWLGPMLVLLGIGCFVWAWLHYENRSDAKPPEHGKPHAHGNHSRVQHTGNIEHSKVDFGDKYYLPAPPLQSEPNVAVRIISSDFRLLPRYQQIGSSQSGIETLVKSVVTVVFEVKNKTTPCETTLDRCSLLIETESGVLMDTKDARSSPYLADGEPLYSPIGVRQLELNAPLTGGKTITRYVNFIVHEHITLQPETFGQQASLLKRDEAVREARGDAHSYDKTGTLRLTIEDHAGTTWGATGTVVKLGD